MTRPLGEPILDRANGRPSGEAAVEFTRQVAALAGAGLPLPSGLRALGRELPGGPLRGMLESVADRVDSGESLDEALTAEGSKFPGPLRGLIAAGARSGRLAEALGRFLDLHDLGDSLRRQLALSLIYPAILLTASFTMFVLVAIVTAHGFAGIFADFGIPLPWITQVLLVTSKAVVNAGWWLAFGPVVGLAVTWVAMRLTLDAAERQRLIQGLPVVGPLSRDTALAQFCPVLALLLECDVPLVEALNLAGGASRDHGMIATAKDMARDVADGKTLGESIADRKPFPGGFGAFLDWAQAHRGLVEALRLSAETFEARARAQAAFLGRFCNAVSMVVVLWWVGLTVIALFLPLCGLMSALGGGGGSAMPWFTALELAGVAVLAVLGIGSVLVIVWPLLSRAASIASEGPPVQAKARKRHGFWYYGPIGWSLLGVLIVASASILAMNRLAADWLASWWLEEIWPMTERMGYVIGFLAVIMIAFSRIAERVARRSAAKAGREGTGSRGRFRLRIPACRFGLRHMMFAMAPMALVMVLARDFGWSLLAVLALVSPPVLVMSAYIILTDRKLVQHEALLRVMAMAARDGQPLGPAVAAFARMCRGGYRRKVGTFAALLEQGATLPQALDRVPGALSKTGEIVARVGWETGTLRRTLDDAVAASEVERSTRVVAVAAIGYPLGVFAVIVGAGSFLLFNVGPTFMQIFKDFDVPLPEPSRRIFALMGTTAARSWSVDMTAGAFLASFVTGLVLVSLLAIAFCLRRALDLVPLGDWLVKRRHTAVVLRALAAATEAGQTLPAVLARLAESYPRAWARRRLARTAARVERGEEWCESLRGEGLMGPADAAVLRSAERVGNLVWAMREAASSGERRLSYRLQAIGQVVQPLVVIAMGGLVLMFALTYFRPLITLIDAMAGADL